MKKYRDNKFRKLCWIIRQISDENTRQLEKWGVQNHTLFEWLTYTTEELGELADAISKFSYDKDKNGKADEVIKEAVSTATLCLKIAEMVLKEKVKPYRRKLSNG